MNVLMLVLITVLTLTPKPTPIPPSGTIYWMEEDEDGNTFIYEQAIPEYVPSFDPIEMPLREGVA